MWGFAKKQVTLVPAEVGGIRVRPSARARHMSLSVDPRLGDVVLTWPRGTSEKKALQFINKSQDWILRTKARAPKSSRFAANGRLSVLGKEYQIVHARGRSLTRIEGDQIIVHGAPEHLPRRLRDFLKEIAKGILTEKTAEKLALLHLRPAGLRVIDPKTRWGSCAADGDLMFSWRLILTPPVVLDYVVAHEVAHRVHMNHSKKFWALCAELAQDAKEGRAWLKKNGGEVIQCR